MKPLDIALELIARSWHVHPLAPRTKQPITPHGKNDASNAEAQVRAWWGKTPNANIGIACGLSQLAVLDCDQGLSAESDFIAWRDRNRLPVTYTVRTGRRDSYGVQMYYAGPMPDVGAWKLDGCSGQVKSLGGYVCAAGSIHPDSGETYQVLVDAPVAPTPESVRRLQSEKPKTGKAGQPITENRNIELYSLLCKWRHDGMTEDGLTVAGLQFNADMVAPPLEEEEVRRITSNAAKHDVPEPDPVAIIGSEPEEKRVTDWRELFHTREDALNAPPISFLIRGFLQCEGVTAIAAPVRERKSLIALNIAHSLLTGETLFGHFEVVKQPSRVLYLCPEVSLGPFTDRIKKIGLMDYVGTTFFYRTLSSDGHLKLDDAALQEALPGSVVFLDTAVRFLEGKENDSGDVRKFADGIFALLRGGAESVVLLHHSPKEGGDFMTLENAMRGSGDMGAFLASCWGTRLQDPTKPYESTSFLSNLKQRDFESKDFEVSCAPDCRMRVVGDPNTQQVSLQTRKGNKGNRDGKDNAAESYIRANIKMPVRKVEEQLAALKIKRGTTWISKARARIGLESGEVMIGGG
jgi:hypothetical protein